MAHTSAANKGVCPHCHGTVGVSYNGDSEGYETPGNYELFPHFAQGLGKCYAGSNYIAPARLVWEEPKGWGGTDGWPAPKLGNSLTE